MDLDDGENNEGADQDPDNDQSLAHHGSKGGARRGVRSIVASRATMIVVPVFGLVLALGVFAVPPAAAVGLWLWVRRLQRRAGLPRFARWSTYTLIGVAGMITVGTVVGLIQSIMAVRAPGLSAAQKQSVLASGIAEAMYNGAFGVLLVVIGAIWITFVRWRASRRP